MTSPRSTKDKSRKRLGAADELEQLCLGAATQIRFECEDILDRMQRGRDQATRASCLSGCGQAMVQLLGRQACRLLRLQAENKRPDDLLRKRLDDLLSLSYSKFYAYKYSKLPSHWRQLYTDTSILKFSSLFLCRSFMASDSSSDGEKMMDDMVQTLDLALIRAGAEGEERGRRWVDSAFSLLEHVSARPQSDERACKRRKGCDLSWADAPGFSEVETLTPPIRHHVRKVPRMSLESFQTHMDRPEDEKLGPVPLVFSGLANDWPAMTGRPWSKPSYLLSRTLNGRRRVPVELGRSYVDNDFGQKIMPFRAFLHAHIDPCCQSDIPDPDSADVRPHQPPKGYLAQHQLLVQIPRLRGDILIPEYCYTAPPPHPTDAAMNLPELEGPQLNVWFGPGGTITPLHTDPYHNILVQVVGRKYVRLYAPRETPCMRPRGKEGGIDMSNTSGVDLGVVEGWDVAQEEAWMRDFRAVPFVDTILQPGDGLYIPIGWWHYVRALSVSFSVSFWWN